MLTMSATGQLEEVQYELHCSICHEYFIQAYTLSCSHSFCFQCINQWTRNHSDCPICRQRIASMTPSRALDNMVATFNNGVPRNSENQTNQVYNVQGQHDDSFERNFVAENINFEDHVSVSGSESGGVSWSTFSDDYDADNGSALSAPIFNFNSSRDEDESVQSDLLRLSDFDSYEEDDDISYNGEDVDEEASEEEYGDEEADEEEYGEEEEYEDEEVEEEEEEFDESGYNDVEVEVFSGELIDIENDLDDFSYDDYPHNYVSDGYSDGAYYDTDYDSYDY